MSAGGPYVKSDGTVIAADLADLTDGTVDTPIDQTISGGTGPTPFAGICGTADGVWTGTNDDGTIANVCDGWDTSGSTATWGNRNSTTDWSNWCNGFGGPCTATWVAPLYCVQQ